MVNEFGKVKCPYCGHEQSIQKSPDAVCRGLWIRCKARQCKKIFEIKIEEKEKPR